MSDLMDTQDLQEMVLLDESAMPSRCVVYTRQQLRKPTGGTGFGPWTARNVEPMRCRLTPNTPQTQMLGERMAAVSDAALQISMTDVYVQAVTIASDDEIDVTSTVEGTEQTDRYKVSGMPTFGSYSTSVSVPVRRVG